MYTYAFFQGNAPALELPMIGIDGHLEVMVGANGVTAIVEPGLEIDTIQAQDDRLMRAVVIHDQVICSVFDQVESLLPLRFGTYFLSGDRLLEHLEVNAMAYQAKLTELIGKAEYMIKLVPHELPPVAALPDAKGRDYFRAKKQQYQDATSQSQTQQRELSWLIEQISQAYASIVQTESSDTLERLYILGDRQQESQLNQQIDQWQLACSTWQVSCGTALPPYHFV